MARGGKISGKHDFKKKVRSKEGNSDDSDEDYVVSDEGRGASDYYCSSLDGCASEESLDNLIEEEEEFKGVRNFNRSKATIGICGRRKKGSTKSRKRGRIVYADEEEEEKKEESENLEEDEEYNVEEEDDDEEEEEKKEEDEEEYNVEEDEEEYNEEEEEDIQVIANKTSQKRRRITRVEQLEEEEEEIQGKRNFSRSKVQKNGVCGKQGNASKTSQKRKRITNTEQLEEEEEDEEWEGDEDEEEEGFECDDEDDEFTPDEEDCSDEEEEISGKMKKSNGTKMGKKVFSKSAYVASTRGQKRSSRASKKPTKSKRSMKGRLRRKVKGDDEDDFMDNGPVIVTRSRKKQGWKRRRPLLSDSDCVAFGSSDFKYTISEEEREQVREAKELCGSLRDNLRSSSILINNEEARVHEDLHQQQKPLGRKGKEKIEKPQGRKGKVRGRI